MDILNRPINSFSYEDIVNFCQEGHREGIQLDYKLDFPAEGLSKFFAAFANTRGGVIIVGVEEDRTRGIPVAWNGIPENAQAIERVHQWASNVEPLPSYEVHVTNVQNGNFFILIRVFEGERTPYYVQNDARVYVRTGNITPPIDIASPEMLELLFGKKQKAELARQIYIKRSQDVYEAAMRRADRNRIREIALEKENYDRERARIIANGGTAPNFRSRYYGNTLGAEAAMCTILLQPYYPKVDLMSPLEISNRIVEIRDGDGTFRLEFPSLNQEPISDGVMNFDWEADGSYISNEQVYSVGLMRSSIDILTKRNGQQMVYIAHIAARLFELMKAANNYYLRSGYQGGLVGFISIEGIEGKPINPTFISRGMFPRENILALMPKYFIDLGLDTSILNDNDLFQRYYIGKIKEIHWALGIGDISDNVIETFLRERRWIAS